MGRLQRRKLARCDALCSACKQMTDYLKDGRRLLPNKAAPVMRPSDMEIFVVGGASYVPGMLYHAGVPGHYFNFGEKVIIADGAPLLLTFNAADPVVSILLKQAGDNVYAYGITVPKLIQFNSKPPPRQEVIDPAAYLGLFKVPRDDVSSATPLQDTETHPLKAYTDLFISYVPFLKEAKLRSAKELVAFADGGYLKCVKLLLKYAEMEERRMAANHAGRGKRSEAAPNSADHGKEVGRKYVELAEAFKAAAPFYEEALEDRFDNIALDENGKPTDASLTTLRTELGCAQGSSCLCSLSLLAQSCNRACNRACNPQLATGRDDPFSTQLLERLEEVLVDFAKGDDATQALQAPSPPGAIVAKGREALAKAGAALSPPAARAGSSADAPAPATDAPAPATDAPAPATDAPDVTDDAPPVHPTKKQKGAGEGAPPRRRPGRPIGNGKAPAAEDSAEFAALKIKHAATVKALESKIEKLSDDLKASIKNETAAVVANGKAQVAKETAERELAKFQATAELQIALAGARAKLGAAHLMLTGQSSSAPPTTPGGAGAGAAGLPTPNALAQFFVGISE